MEALLEALELDGVPRSGDQEQEEGQDDAVISEARELAEAASTTVGASTLGSIVATGGDLGRIRSSTRSASAVAGAAKAKDVRSKVSESRQTTFPLFWGMISPDLPH